MIEEFIEDYLAVETHLVGLSRTQRRWESPGAGAIGMASLGSGSDHYGIQHALIVRGFQDEVVAPLRSEAQLGRCHRTNSAGEQDCAVRKGVGSR